ncbi:TPA: heparinase II/III family protein [Kluyvera ascorbata]|nr:heparinase II/III family protein [Kluyvera ascorbata]
MTLDSSLFLSSHDLADLRAHQNRDSLPGATLRQQQRQLAAWLEQPLWIPGHGEGGGPEHAQHKLNYQMIDLAGLHWLLSGDPCYRDRVLAVLSGYADIYPTLGSATSRDSNPPGRLFHQTLNEDMFLLYAASAWSCVKGSASPEMQAHIEANLLCLMVHEALTVHSATFDIVHNHGMWSVAAIAICGYVTDHPEWVEVALHGRLHDDTSGGFYAQLDQLFSLDGYYIEGLYYQRFALRPLLLLATVIDRYQPELNIWAYRDRLIHRACFTMFDMAFPDGSLPALNDASKTMNLQDEGALMAVSLCRQHYGASAQLSALAHFQQQCWLCRGALELSEDGPHSHSPRPSLLVRDGVMGERGAGGILRTQPAGQNESMALLWWGGHGNIAGMHSALNHGHFDGLHLSYFTEGVEILQDYGFARWVNVEPKFGGRYVPENNSYAKQTIAHNTVVVDSGCQNQGDKERAAVRYGNTRFFSTDGPHQAMSAVLEDYWPDVTQQRTVLLLALTQCERPLLVDLFTLQSGSRHQYDYCLHTLGQIIRSSLTLETLTTRSPLGDAHGYQHLWRCANAHIPAFESSQLSWLQRDRFYTLTSVIPQKGELIIARTGASDPAFNLREEPTWILRTEAQNTLFANVLECHGEFDESREISRQARGSVARITIEEHSPEQIALLIHFHQGKPCRVTVDNRPGYDTFSVC